jgi:hypothetical protein
MRDVQHHNEAIIAAAAAAVAAAAAITNSLIATCLPRTSKTTERHPQAIDGQIILRIRAA